MADKRYILGIDQGSSKTHAVIGDDLGNILGFGKSYGACHSNTGMQYSMDAVVNAVSMALKEADKQFEDIELLVAGMTGVDWEFETPLLVSELEKHTGIKRVEVVNDCIIAMRAGTKKTYGAVLCAGSGLNCAVRDEKGKEIVYGFYIDEEYQGGSGLGRACVKAVIDAETGVEEATMLTEMLKEKFNCEKVDDILYRKISGQIENAEYLELPIILEKAAHMGDKQAKNILYRFGQQFGKYVAAAALKLQLEKEIDVVLSGSIFKCKEPQLRQGVKDYLENTVPKAKLVDALYEPIVGAYLLGLDILTKKEGGWQDYQSIEEVSKRYSLRRIKDE